MDFELMIGSFPKLLSATVITLKAFVIILIFWIVYWFTFCNFKNE